MKKTLSRYFGDKAFYKSALAILLPIIIQNGITNLVSLLDNIMVGSLGTEQMSGVSIVNQYFFIFNLICFGVISAAGIFTAQFKGTGDVDGIRATLRAKLYMCYVASILAVIAFFSFSEPLINLFLHDGSNEGDLELTMQFAKKYLNIILFGLLPFAVSAAFSSTMRETGETVFPMITSFVAVGTNAVFNVLLIFGLLGFPKLGVEGAAIATVLSRFVELGMLLIYSFRSKKNGIYFKGAFSFRAVPANLMREIGKKGLPLLANEFLWSLAITFRNQCFSTRGLDSVAAQNISTTITNLFSIVFFSMGTAISIIIGNQLGAGLFEKAEDTDRKLITFGVLLSGGVGILLVGFGFVFPLIYNTTAEARSIATFMIVVYGICNPLWAYINSSYFTIRSGGLVFQTMLSDSIFMWVCVVPVSAVCAYLTDMSIYRLYICTTAAECLKAVVGYILLKRKDWLKTIVVSKD